jgi:SAM-dependent methyltransferase
VSEIVNVEMAAAWDGDEGDDWTLHEQQHNDAVRALSERLMAAAAVGRAEHVLDLGCGTGETTREAARAAVDGDALGVDLGAHMLERARERAVTEDLTNVSFLQADAQVHSFAPESFDLVLSRLGGMFFSDPVGAFTNVAAATRPGGRMVLVTWQALARNEWLGAIRGAFALGRTLPTPPSGAPGPFGLSDPDHVRSTLDAAGWSAVELDDVQVPFRAGADADDAYAFVAGMGIVRGLVQDLDDDQRRAGFDALRATIDAHDTGTDAGVVFGSAAWIVHATRAS